MAFGLQTEICSATTCAWSTGSLVSVILQTEARDASLRILERTGLVLKEQGSVLVVTLHDQEEEVKVEDIRGMSPTHIAKLYTVSSLDLSAHIVHAVAVAGAVVPSSKAHALIVIQCLQPSLSQGHCVAKKIVQAQVPNACEDVCFFAASTHIGQGTSQCCSFDK